MEEMIKGLASGAGVAGIILGWHLLVFERRLKKLEEAQDRSTRSDILRLIASPHVSADVKETAAEIMKEIELATESRKKQL